MTPEEVWTRLNPLDLPTLTYLCGYCHKDKVPSPDQGMKKPKKTANRLTSDARETGNPNKMLLSAAEWTDIDSDSNHQLQGSQAANQDGEEADDESDTGLNLSTNQRQSISRTPSRRRQSNKIDNAGEDATKNDRNKPICPYFRKGQCRHGISGKGCSKGHPQLCRKLMLNGTRGPKGCTQGKNCERLHPKMCPSSINHLECLNDNCSLYHVKGTRRLNSPPKIQDQPTRNHHQADRPASRMANRSIRPEATHQSKSEHSHEDFLEMLRSFKQEILQAVASQKLLGEASRVPSPAAQTFPSVNSHLIPSMAQHQLPSPTAQTLPAVNSHLIPSMAHHQTGYRLIPY